jgi:hypothetical protein
MVSEYSKRHIIGSGKSYRAGHFLPIALPARGFRMKRIKRSLFLLPLLLLLAGAVSTSAQKVKYNYSQGTDFSKYKTYKWVRVENRRYPNDLMDEQIMRSIDAQLGQKGLTKTEGDPDVVVVYQAAVSQQQQWNAYSTGGGYWGWGGWGGMGSSTMTSSTLNIGTLNVDFYDVSTKKQIWRGEATKTLGEPKDPAKLQRNLDKATAKLLKNYPPGKRK